MAATAEFAGLCLMLAGLLLRLEGLVERRTGIAKEGGVESLVVVDGRGDTLTWVIREGRQQLWVVLVRDAWERTSDFSL